MKKVIYLLIALVLAATGVGVYWLKGNLDGLVAQAIHDYGSAMTQASVKVDSVMIQTTDGRGELRGLFVGNPKGFKTDHALKAEVVELEVDIASLAKDVIVIKKIAILAPDVIYEKGDGMTNFDALQKNVAQYLGPQEKPKAGEKEKKFIINEFIIKDIKTQASAAFMDGKTMAVSLPDIHLRDLGKAKGGATSAELTQEIIAAVKGKLTGAVSFDKLMKSTGEALDKAGKAIKGLFQ
ncbi:hypothetical protein RQP54_09230 [Curvibacter sp. APW13]|uniref:hypothetical protein n=1 Tax=Curvibacter sp. APW13 TaxID=3077236 RepID=UPI0028E0622E|nr:hypothetical protein [Curvibacter sp. APW13]MDT8991044.1 hypothetical protein [Curvibacter sp. APW13]